jgi:hypothetical protein
MVTPSTTYPTKTGLWSNPDFRSDQPTFKRIRRGTDKNCTVSSATKTVFGVWSSEMHVEVGRKKKLLMSPQNAQTSSANCIEVSKFSLYTQLQITHINFLLYCHTLRLIFIYDSHGIITEQKTWFRSQGGQIIPFPFP